MTFPSYQADDAIGGYREGLTIAELDATWPNAAVRDARPNDQCLQPWPLVVFSHGSGAFRAGSNHNEPTHIR